MKNIFFLILLGSLLISCGEDEEVVDLATEIHPPEWILGKWEPEADGYGWGYEFKENDFCDMTDPDEPSNCYSVFLTPTQMEIEEQTRSDSHYHLKLHNILFGGVDPEMDEFINYYFEKINATTFEYDNDLYKKID